MKAKIKTLIILIAIFSVTLIAGICAGCIGEDDAKDKADARGMTASVTYYTNGGSIDGELQVYRTDYYKPGTPIFNIGVDKIAPGNTTLPITRTNYVFAGWEYALLDEDGLPILYELDNDGNRTGKQLTVLENGTASMIGSTGREKDEREKRFEAVPNGVKVFENGHPTVSDKEHVYLVATWVKDVVLEYRLITDEPMTDDQNITNNNGDVIYTSGFSTSDSLMLSPDKTPGNLTFKGFSYINLYWDAEGKEAVVVNDKIYKKEGENSVIYAKYLSGSWSAVRNANDAANMLEATGNQNFFVVYDIDCSNGLFSYKTTYGNFGGTIEGNGKKLTNITIEHSAKNGDVGSLLGTLTETAKIKNLTIENVAINISLNNSMTAHVLVTGISEGTEFENFVLDTVTLKINMSGAAQINNIQRTSDGYIKDNWLYGFGATGTDAEFENIYGKLVQNGTLIINNETVVSGGQV